MTRPVAAARRAARITRAHWSIFADWTLAVIGLVGGVALIREDLTLWSVLSTLAGGYFLVRAVRDFAREWRRYTPEGPPRGTVWSYDGPYASWHALGDQQAHAVYSPELNTRLRDEDPIAVRLGEPWVPQGAAAELRRKLWIDKGRLNEPKLRLATDLLPDTTSVELQRTDYASFVATNRLAYEHWWDERRAEAALTFEDVEPGARIGTLPTLRNSRCSNHVGGDLIAVGDGFVFLQLQKRTNGMYPGHWVASSSGSFDVKDHRGATLQDLVKVGMLRELKEEMRLSPALVPSPADTKVLGYSRATYLGGKPQFYGVTRIGRVTPGTDEFAARHERLDFETGTAGLLARLETFEASHGHLVAPPLSMLFTLLRDWVAEDDESAAAWLWPR